MTFKRWIPTFLAFPIAGAIAFQTLGSFDGPLAGAAGGLLAGAIIGAGQWLALRSGGAGRRWVAHTAGGMSAGLALAAVVTGAGTEVPDLVVGGLIAGTVVGATQSTLLARGAATWTAVTGAGWALAWLTTSQVIVDAERGFYVFGSSGALIVTLVTGLALRVILVAPARPV